VQEGLEVLGFLLSELRHGSAGEGRKWLCWRREKMSAAGRCTEGREEWESTCRHSRKAQKPASRSDFFWTEAYRESEEGSRNLKIGKNGKNRPCFKREGVSFNETPGRQKKNTYTQAQSLARRSTILVTSLDLRGGKKAKAGKFVTAKVERRASRGKTSESGRLQNVPAQGIKYPHILLNTQTGSRTHKLLLLLLH